MLCDLQDTTLQADLGQVHGVDGLFTDLSLLAAANNFLTACLRHSDVTRLLYAQLKRNAG